MTSPFRERTAQPNRHRLRDDALDERPDDCGGHNGRFVHNFSAIANARAGRFAVSDAV